MAQIFSPSADTWLRLGLIVAVVLLAGAMVVPWALVRSDYLTSVGFPRRQPVPFSHQHHVGGLGLDCRYCHTAVETSADAGYPPTHVCMTCHSQLYAGQEMLAPVRRSLAENRPLRWKRVAELPQYVYFNHAIHVAKGIGCAECHGRIDRMAIAFRARPFFMSFCLDCHRDPAPHLRPLDRVTDMEWQPPPEQHEIGPRLIGERHIDLTHLTDCVTCHR